MNVYIVTLGVTIGIGIILTGFCRWLARKIHFVNKPNKIVVQHTESVAYLGGLAVFLSFLLSHFILDSIASVDVCYLLGAGLFMVLGLVDDAIEFKPLHKFILQLGVAYGVVGLGLHFEFTGSDILDYLISGFWILILVNAYNLIDVCDGLAAGVGMIGLIIMGGFIQLPLSALILAASILGFLFFNRPNASIYLGDSGSHLLGFSIAYFQLTSIGFGDLPLLSFLPFVFVSLLPLYELFFLIIIRKSKGLKWWHGSPDHLALRLQKMGWSKWQTLGIGYCLSIVTTLPFVASSLDASLILIIMAYLIVFGLLGVFTRYLLKA